MRWLSSPRLSSIAASGLVTSKRAKPPSPSTGTLVTKTR